MVKTQRVGARCCKKREDALAVLDHSLLARRIEEFIVQGEVLLRAARVELHAVELRRKVLRHVTLVVDEPLDGLAARAAVEIPVNGSVGVKEEARVGQ